MTKTFIIDNTEYTITDCTAHNFSGEPIDAIHIEYVAESGDVVAKELFCEKMPETAEDFKTVINDPFASLFWLE